MACRLPLLLISALLAGASQAAELGEPRVSSFIGQLLVADVELVMLEDPAKAVAVRLAHPEVYRGANVVMSPVLSTLTMSVMRRDGRQFLHVTSLKPVDTPHLHLYLELLDGSQRTVRLATLWLSPDPNPAPPPPIPAPAPVIAAPVVAPVKAPVAVAARPRPPAPKPVPKPVPPKPAPVEEKHVAAAAPAACAPQPVPDTNACVVLGAKNVMLREQLGQLEDKVKVLQVAMGAPASAVVPPVKPYKPKKKKAEPPPPEPGTPWALIGGGVVAVLALLAALLVLRRRKGAARPGRRAEPKVGLLPRLKARFRRKPAPVKAAEPTLDEAAHDSSTQV
ncbi:MAG: hypothetical protein AB1437_10055 [Pseudomonadota bacterium]